MSDPERSDRNRMLAVDAARIKREQPKRDKRTSEGIARHVRQVGDHSVLLGACRRAAGCARAVAAPAGVCPRCGGAALTPDERSR